MEILTVPAVVWSMVAQWGPAAGVLLGLYLIVRKVLAAVGGWVEKLLDVFLVKFIAAQERQADAMSRQAEAMMNQSVSMRELTACVGNQRESESLLAEEIAGMNLMMKVMRNETAEMVGAVGRLEQKLEAGGGKA